MKTLFVFCFCVASALAGVQDWSRDAEDQYLSLYRRYCTGSSSAGNDGDLEWHCKSPKERPTVQRKTYSHRLDLPSSNKQQLVFIEAPADEYQHNILVTGQANNNHKTKIVVVPSADRHDYQVRPQVSVTGKAEKPSIFFLRSNPKGSDQSTDIRSSDSQPWSFNSNNGGGFDSNPRFSRLASNPPPSSIFNF